MSTACKTFAVALLLVCLQPSQARLLDTILGSFAPARSAQDPAGPESVTWSSGAAPDFCHNLDCPKFGVVKRTEHYEVRSYEAASFINTTVTGMKFELALPKAFTALYGYINGGNVVGAKMPMTTPVTTSFIPKEDFKGSEHNYTVSFFLPFAVQDDPPAPTNSDVRVDRWPGGTMYVRVFGGYAFEGKIISEASSLLSALKDDGVHVYDDRFFFATYDAPQHFVNRHNEVAFFGRPWHA